MNCNMECALQMLKLYLCSTVSQKRLIQYLYKFIEKKMVKVFPFISTIAKYVGVSDRQVLNILKDYEDNQWFILERIPRKTKSGKRTSNEFILDPNFIPVYRWLSFYGYLNSPKSKFEKIIEHWQNEHKYDIKSEDPFHPKTPSHYTPTPPFSIDKKIQYKDSSFYRDKKETLKEKDSFGFISNPLRGLKLAPEFMISVSKRFSEHLIVEAVEVLLYQKARNKIKTTDQRYLMGILKYKKIEYEKNKGS